MGKSRESWEHFAHQADMGVRGYGSTLADAFAQAAFAMMATVTDLKNISPAIAVTIECQAPDVEYLLVDWLNALIYEIATRHMLFSRFDVEIEKNKLRARAWGEMIDVAKHHPAVEVKGATYTALRVEQTRDGRWCAQCVVDV